MRETTEVRHYNTEFKICNANLKKIIYNDKEKAIGTVTRESRRTEIIVKSRDKKRVENESENI